MHSNYEYRSLSERDKFSIGAAMNRWEGWLGHPLGSLGSHPFIEIASLLLNYRSCLGTTGSDIVNDLFYACRAWCVIGRATLVLLVVLLLLLLSSSRQCMTLTILRPSHVTLSPSNPSSPTFASYSSVRRSNMDQSFVTVPVQQLIPCFNCPFLISFHDNRAFDHVTWSFTVHLYVSKEGVVNVLGFNRV